MTPAFLQEVALDKSQTYYPHVAKLVLDAQEMMRVLGPHGALQQFRSFSRLREVHAQVSEKYYRMAGSHVLRCRFPHPPVPGTPHILQLMAAEGAVRIQCAPFGSPTRAPLVRAPLAMFLRATSRRTMLCQPGEGAHPRTGLGKI